MMARALASLVVLALLAGCASGAEPTPHGADADVRDVDGSEPGPLPPSMTRREIVLLPGEVVAWTVQTPGDGSLEVLFRVYAGLVDVTMDGPGDCEGFHLQTATVAYANGVIVESKDCGDLPADSHTLRLHAGKAAFSGAIELQGGWFA